MLFPLLAASALPGCVLNRSETGEIRIEIDANDAVVAAEAAVEAAERFVEIWRAVRADTDNTASWEVEMQRRESRLDALRGSLDALRLLGEGGE